MATALLTLGFSSLLLAQTTELSREQFYAPYREALSKSRQVARRHRQNITRFENGSPHLVEEWLYEYQPPSKIRFVQKETFKGLTKIVEQINIGETKYCRKDNGPWELVKGYCIGGSGSGGLPNVISSHFSSEKANLNETNLTLYREFTTYKNSYSKTVETDGPSFWENKYWLDRLGFMVRQEIRQGLVEKNEILRSIVETYEYDPNIKIEAPIK